MPYFTISKHSPSLYHRQKNFMKSIRNDKHKQKKCLLGSKYNLKQREVLHSLYDKEQNKLVWKWDSIVKIY